VMSRKINLIVVHCAATNPHMDIGAHEIRQWHLAKGWSDIGYHNVIRRDGTLEHGRDLAIAGAHAKGYNQFSIGVCLVGGVDVNNNPENNFTKEQFTTLKGYLDTMVNVFPEAKVLGHRDLPDVKKACPSFNVVGWYYGVKSGQGNT